MLINISKNICLGLVAAVLAKHDICMEHFLKAIVACHDSGHFKLVCHLVRLLFPFGLESWHMIKRLSKSDVKSTSYVTDQYFSNIMAFYYRAILSEHLASEELRKSNKESLQNSVANDSGECTSLKTLEPSIAVSNIDDIVTSCGEGTIAMNPDQSQSADSSSNNSSVQSTLKDDCGSTTTKDNAERENNISRKLEETSFQEIYRIGLVCSTVLLSDVYAQFQALNDDLEDRDDSDRKTDLEMSLSVRIERTGAGVTCVHAR